MSGKDSRGVVSLLKQQLQQSDGRWLDSKTRRLSLTDLVLSLEYVQPPVVARLPRLGRLVVLERYSSGVGVGLGSERPKKEDHKGKVSASKSSELNIPRRGPTQRDQSWAWVPPWRVAVMARP